MAKEYEVKKELGRWMEFRRAERSRGISANHRGANTISHSKDCYCCISLVGGENSIQRP